MGTETFSPFSQRPLSLFSSGNSRQLHKNYYSIRRKRAAHAHLFPACVSRKDGGVVACVVLRPHRVRILDPPASTLTHQDLKPLGVTGAGDDFPSARRSVSRPTADRHGRVPSWVPAGRSHAPHREHVPSLGCGPHVPHARGAHDEYGPAHRWLPRNEVWCHGATWYPPHAPHAPRYTPPPSVCVCVFSQMTPLPLSLSSPSLSPSSDASNAASTESSESVCPRPNSSVSHLFPLSPSSLSLPLPSLSLSPHLQPVISAPPQFSPARPNLQARVGHPLKATPSATPLPPHPHTPPLLHIHPPLHHCLPI